MARARVGERQARREAEPRGGRVDADEALRVFDLGDERRGAAKLASSPSPRSFRARSVARRGSHRERKRRFVKSLVLASPGQAKDFRRVEALRPLGRGQARLDEPRGEGGRPGKGAPAARGAEPRARRGGDLEARLGGAGEFLGRAIGARLDEQRRRRPGPRGEQQAARRGKVVGLQSSTLRRRRPPARRSSKPPPSPGTGPARRARARRRAGSVPAHGRRAPARRARPSRRARNPRPQGAPPRRARP